jgi:hypothetical protein
MSKKSLLEEYEEQVKGSIEYYQRRIARSEEEREAGIELIKMIEPLNIEPESRYVYDGSIRLEYETVEDARKVLSHVLAKTPIDRFVKVSRDAGSQLKWDYTVDYKGVMLAIGPAEPSKDCVAVKRVSSYTSWVCEKG